MMFVWTLLIWSSQGSLNDVSSSNGDFTRSNNASPEAGYTSPSKSSFDSRLVDVEMTDTSLANCNDRLSNLEQTIDGSASPRTDPNASPSPCHSTLGWLLFVCLFVYVFVYMFRVSSFWQKGYFMRMMAKKEVRPDVPFLSCLFKRQQITPLWDFVKIQIRLYCAHLQKTKLKLDKDITICKTYCEEYTGLLEQHLQAGQGNSTNRPRISLEAGSLLSKSSPHRFCNFTRRLHFGAQRSNSSNELVTFKINDWTPGKIGDTEQVEIDFARGTLHPLEGCLEENICFHSKDKWNKWMPIGTLGFLKSSTPIQ